MTIGEQVTIGSIITALKQEGIKTSDLAKQIDGLSEKPLRKALHAAGYQYSNKAPKGWHFITAGPEPLNKSIFDFIDRSSSSVNKTSPTVHSHFTQSNNKITTGEIDMKRSSSTLHPQFTSDEVNMIKEMLDQWQRLSSQTAATQEREGIETTKDLSLHDRIKQLPQNEKTRKTIVIDKEIGKQLDQFCQDERVSKSDILHLALMDFLNK